MLERTRQKCREIRNRFYPHAERPGVVHENAMLAAGGPDKTLLEIGCGREGKVLRRVAPHYKFAVGMDLEVAVQPQPGDNWRLIQGDVHRIPLDDQSVDVIANKNLVEHLADPVKVFEECKRVLRPGGRLILLTVNQWFPPILLARALPHSVRQFLNRIASGTKEEDTFRTYYRANSAKKLATAAQRAGLQVGELRHVSQHPDYLMFSALLYRLGVAVERACHRIEGLRGWRHFLHAAFVKPAEAEPGAARRANGRLDAAVPAGFHSPPVASQR